MPYATELEALNRIVEQQDLIISQLDSVLFCLSVIMLGIGILWGYATWIQTRQIWKSRHF